MPTLLFLRINEGAGDGERFGFEGEGGKHVGRPRFALNVTSEGSSKEECRKVQGEAVKEMEGGSLGRLGWI